MSKRLTYEANSGASEGAACGCCRGRRDVLAGLLGLGAAAAAPLAVRAQATAGPKSIDVHHHFVQPPYLQSLSFAMPPLRAWSPAKDLEDLDRAGTQVAMLSVTTPGFYFGDAEKARTLCRTCNDYAAKMISDHPDRYRLFTGLPMPDLEGTLREIAYGFDQLKADGIGLFTSYDGKYLGHESFAPVFEELNRRKAIVYVHPSEPKCCVNMMPELQPSMPTAITEYGADTTRTIANFLFSGAARRYPDVRMIFAHAGGTMPYLIERFRIQSETPGAEAKLPQGGLMPAIGAFFYDTAQTSNPVTMAALRLAVPMTQILFGTDFPYRTSIDHVEGLKRSGFTSAELDAIFRGNALRLMPQLKAA